MKNILIMSFLFFTFLVAGCSLDQSYSVNPENSQLIKSEELKRNSFVYPSVIPLPDYFHPEGIAIGRGHTFYAGSLVNGAIYSGDLRTGEGNILYSGSQGQVAVGLKYDNRSNYLFVAGGPSGGGYVIDGSTGQLISSFTFPGGVFINDVIVTKDAAYFTDSYKPVLYRIPLGPAGSLPDPISVSVIQLSGDYEFFPNASSPNGINNNGIEATPNGKYLFLNNMANGALYKVNAETGEAIEIDLGGQTLFFSDGLVLNGHILYVVQNFFNQISVVALNSNYTSGVIQEVITNPGFDLPSTAAKFGNSLYVINARFTTPNPVEFNIVKVSR